MPPKKVKAGKRKSGGQAAPASPVKKTKKQEESESEEDSDEEMEEEEVPVKKAAKQAKAPKGKKPAKKDEEEDSDESDASEEEEAAAENGKKAKKAAAEEEDDDDDESEEEEVKKPAKKGKKAKAEKKKPAPKEDDDDDEESDDDEDEEAAPAKEAAEESDDDDDDDDDEDEGSDGESKKRKKSQQEKPAKKARTEDTVSLFLGNVGDLKEEKVSKFFKKNEIIVADVRKVGKNGNCFVDLENAEDLDKALELNGQTVGGNVLQIEKAKPRKSESQDQRGGGGGDGGDGDRDAATLFVKNLPYEASEDDLREMFDGCTEVRMPRTNGKTKGFAFVQFASAAEVKNVLEEKQGCELQGRSLFLDVVGQKGNRQSFGGGAGGGRRDLSGSKGEAGKTKVLFVKNLPYSLTGDGLQDHFDTCKSARIATFPDTGKPRGFGFVEFDSADDCKAAYESMQGTEVDGRSLTLDYASELGDRDRGSSRMGGRGGGRGFGGRGGGRGFGGRGRGGDRGRGGGFRGGFRGGRGGGGFGGSQGKRKTFDDDD